MALNKVSLESKNVQFYNRIIFIFFCSMTYLLTALLGLCLQPCVDMAAFTSKLPLRQADLRIKKQERLGRAKCLD